MRKYLLPPPSGQGSIRVGDCFQQARGREGGRGSQISSGFATRLNGRMRMDLGMGIQTVSSFVPSRRIRGAP